MTFWKKFFGGHTSLERISAQDRIQAGERSVDRFAVLAGTIFGAWLGRAAFGWSAMALGLSAIVGFVIVSPVVGQEARSAAGAFLGTSGLREYGSDEENVDVGLREERIAKGQRVAKILLTALIVSSALGLIFYGAIHL